MRPLKARVHNGRLMLDEPTALPDGEVIYLRPVEPVVQADDDLDEAEQRELDEALDAGLASARAGDVVDAEDFVRNLLARG